MARERAALSKRLRFEIFKRDNFRCKYCGASPADRPLHVDHVVPIAGNGTDDPENLVTSCGPCNLGKAAVPLEQKQHAHAVGRLTEADKEHAEQIRAWIDTQRDVADAKSEIVDLLTEEWERRVGDVPRGLQSRLVKMASEFGIPRLLEAFDIVGAKGLYSSRSVPYLHGILRKWRTEAGLPPARPAPTGRVADLAARIEKIFREAPDGSRARWMSIDALYDAGFEPPENHSSFDEWMTYGMDSLNHFVSRDLAVEFVESGPGRFTYRVTRREEYDPYREAFEELRMAVDAGVGHQLWKARHAGLEPDLAELRVNAEKAVKELEVIDGWLRPYLDAKAAEKKGGEE